MRDGDRKSSTCLGDRGRESFTGDFGEVTVFSDVLKKIRVLWARLIHADAFTLGAVVVTILAAWCFLEVADEVTEGETRRLDEWVVRSLRHPGDPSRPVGPPWLMEAVRDLTALGGVTVLVLVIGAVAGYLWICRAYHSIWLVLSASLGGLLLSTLLKGVFRRPRPDLTPYLTHVASSSFPSGHTMNSAVVYLTLGLLLARLSDRRRLKVYFIAVATLLTFLVGMSRVYLGAHYPSDILAGWTAGATWAGLCWLVARRLRRTGSIEPIG
jgi:undecaprenyl-diphosphatase